MTPRRIRILTASTAATLAASLTLSGCALLAPQPGGGAAEPGEQTTTAPREPETNAPRDDASGIVVLSDDEVTKIPTFVRSEPAGTWPVGEGIPVGFPAGVPVYPDRWIENNVTEFTTNGLPGYSAMFWGDYDDIDALLVRCEELGYEIDDSRDEGKRVITMFNERYKLIITATESATDPVSGELLDPSYSYLIVFL